MKILVLGAYNSPNLGDPVICDCVADTLRRHYPEAEICCRDLLDRQPPQPGQDTPLRAGQKTHLRRKLRFWVTKHTSFDASLRRELRRVQYHGAYLNDLCGQSWDLAVVAGGQLFMDSYALFVEAVIRRLTNQGVPVICNAVGIGPSCSESVCARLGAALKHPLVTHISCRDDAALAETRYHPGKPIHSTTDPALYADRTYGVRRDPESQTVGLGVLFPGFTPARETLRFWQDVIRALEARQIPWQMFTNGDPLDLSYVRAILASMPELQGGEEAVIRPCDTKPGDLVRTLAGYGSIIAARLHSNIIAVSLNIPAVGVVWDQKLPAFYAKLGCAERCCGVETSAEAVVDNLLNAQRQGYDRSRVENQRQAAETMLLHAVEAALNRETQR